MIELIIVMTLTLIILGMLFQMFNTNNRIISDVNIKSTLQTEGQAIQEALSKIGMQAISMKCDEETDVKSLIINSLNESGEKCKFKVETEKRDGNKNSSFYISEYNCNDNDIEILKSKKLFTKNLKEFNIVKDENFAQLEIVLDKKKGYSNITYPVNIKFTFRNKDK